MADADTPRNADFVGRVVGDAKNPPETRLLTGWLGDSGEEGYRRLYTDAELSTYLDLPADAILHTEAIRDAQPAGAVFVWVRSDAVLKPGGSASSRAARFLQGQVQQDFASGAGRVDLSSPEKAGFRCVTQVPCGEPTGFTGQCTKQPDVGGAWPCITAIPHCAEPTGFTGQCTHQPWPHPTRYVGCTFLHCPTHDLTCIPYICHVVATGLPGCGVVDPGRVGGDPAARAGLAAEGGEGAAERPAAPATAIPGCGYTQTWGLCETHLLGCGSTNTSVLACGVTNNPACVVNAGGLGFRAAGPGPVVPINTLLHSCNVSAAGACPSAVDACPSMKGCHTPPPTAMTTCTQVGPPCPSPGTICTQMGLQCPTSCGSDCQTQQANCTHVGCTQVGPQCPSLAGTVCPTTPQLDCTFGCTQAGTGCPVTTFAVACNINAAAGGGQAFRAAGPIGQTAVLGCTQTGNNCLTIPDGDCTFFGGCQPTQTCPTQPQGHCTCAGPGCPPTSATHCFICPPHHHSWLPWQCPVPTPWCPPTPYCPPITQPFVCGGGPSAVDACPTRLCGGGGAFGAAARPAAGFAAGQLGTSGLLRCTQPGFCQAFFSLFEVQCPAVLGTVDLRCQTRFPECIPSFPPICQVTEGCPPPRSHVFVACTLTDPNCRFVATTGGQCQVFARAAGPVQQEPTPATVCFICTQVPQFCCPVVR